MSEQLSKRYPIGQFEYGKTWSIAQSKKHIQILAEFPKKLKKTLKKMSNLELDTQYRRGGWTVRQVVHHLADSHVNAYIRMKMAVTEILPIIKPYEESKWAELEDGKEGSIKLSVKLLIALHKRWVKFLCSLSAEDLELAYYHPGLQRSVPLVEAIALYVWHSNHHLAHIHLVADVKKDKKEKSDKKEKNKKKSAKKAKILKAKRNLTEEQKAAMAAIRAEMTSTIADSAPVAEKAPKAKKVLSEAHLAKLAAGRAAKSGKTGETALAPVAEKAPKAKKVLSEAHLAKLAAGRAAKAGKTVETAPAPVAETATKQKRVMSEEQKAKMAAGRAAKAGKTVETTSDTN